MAKHIIIIVVLLIVILVALKLLKKKKGTFANPLTTEDLERDYAGVEWEVA